jgi:hypothetical protein
MYILEPMILLQDERSRWMRCNAYTVYDFHSKAIYELKVILLQLWRVNVKDIGGFINIPFADFFMDKTAP